LRRLLLRTSSRPWAENRPLLAALAAVVLMRVAVRMRFATVIRALALVPGQTPENDRPEALAEAALIGKSVRTAAARLPGTTTCLAQALAAGLLLGRRGIDSTLYLGVARNAAERDGFEAHAWLRSGSLVVTGAENARYAAVASYRTGRRVATRPEVGVESAHV
jgi:hypothetical protein